MTLIEPTVDSTIPPQRPCTPQPATILVREKVCIRFRKDGPLRFLGHHDLMRVWDRLLRRAHLPVRFSQGFNPRPHLSSPLALALGVIGHEEILELELTQLLSCEQVRQLLDEQTVAGLTIVSVTSQPLRQRTRVVAVEYLCPLPAALDHGPLQERIDQLLQAAELIMERRLPGKPPRPVNLRPFIDTMTLDDNGFRVRLRLVDGATARPEEILRAMDLESLLAQGMVLARTRVILAETPTPQPVNEPSSSAMRTGAHSAKVQHEERNAHQCPPGGRDPHCHS